MKPILGWTMLSREEMRQAERLASGEQDTRDEIGFLLIHQGFADRFFPGTSVLHIRVRYALFVPWLYLQAAAGKGRGSDLDATIRRQLILLAIRLKQIGGEPFGVIGGDKLGQLTSQPPDRVYWTALRAWGLLLPAVSSRSEVLRRLQAGRRTLIDDDGGSLDDQDNEVFASLPNPPDGWDDPDAPLRFKVPAKERDFLRRKLSLLARPGETAQSLLAKLVATRVSFSSTSSDLPLELDARADTVDKQALGIARDAAGLAAIGRAVYGALVEQLRADDGLGNDATFRTRLHSHFQLYGQAASRCDLEGAELFLPDLPPHVRTVLYETRAYVRAGKPENFFALRDCYQKAETTRKTTRRARLLNTVRAAQRRAEWDPKRHNTTPLHYRWDIVRNMLNDLSGQ